MNCPNCSELQNQSEIIWKDSKDAIDFGCPLYEETISQTTSLRINRNLNSRTKIKKAPNESKNGADWLWVIYDRFSRKHLKFAVQAKRLDPDGLYSATKIKQVSAIRRYSKMSGFIPIYIFFNHDWDGFLPRNFLTSFIFQGIPAALGATYIHGNHFAYLTRHFTATQNLNRGDHRVITDLVKQNCKPWFQLLCRCQISRRDSFLDEISRRVQEFNTDSVSEEFFNFIEPQETNQLMEDWIGGKLINDDDFWGSLEMNDWKSEFYNPDFIMGMDVGRNEIDD